MLSCGLKGSGQSDANGNFNFGCVSGFYQVQISGTGLTTNTYSVPCGVAQSSNASLLSLNNVQFADQFPGADAGIKIANALAALPSTGGIVDARGLTGAQACSTNPFAGVTKPFVVLLGQATFTTAKTWNISAGGSGQYIVGAGPDVTVVDFEPTAPLIPGVNDRAIDFDWNGAVVSPGGNVNRRVSGAISVGDVKFTVNSASDASDLQAGDWIHVVTEDPNAGGMGVPDAVAFDWMQVFSVAGTTVNVQRPFRTAFPNYTTSSTIANSPTGAAESGTTVTLQFTSNHSFVSGQTLSVSGVGVAGYNGTFRITVPSANTVQYTAVSGLAASGGGTATSVFLYFNRLVSPIEQNVGISGLTVKSSYVAASGIPGIQLGRIRNGYVENCVISMPSGQPLYAYRSNGAAFRRNKVRTVAGNIITSEFGESTDFEVSDNQFLVEGTSAGRATATVDMGAAFFRVVNNIFDSMNSGQLSFTNGAHHGVVSGNTLGLLFTNTGIAIQAYSVTNLTITNNTLAGTSSGSKGISFTTNGNLQHPIPSNLNFIAFNDVGVSYFPPYDVNTGGDTLIAVNPGTNNMSIGPVSNTAQLSGAPLTVNGVLAFRGSAYNNPPIILTANPTTGRLVTFPDNTGTVAELNFAQTWTMNQTLTSPLHAKIQGCGTTTICSASPLSSSQIVTGTVTLSGGSATVTGFSPAFASASTFNCVANDTTTMSNPSKAVPASASSITVTGTGTDVISYSCAGN